jgi:hypothetical protein
MMRRFLALFGFWLFWVQSHSLAQVPGGPDDWAAWLNACSAEMAFWRPEIQAFNRQVVAAYEGKAKPEFTFARNLSPELRRGRRMHLDSLYREALRVSPPVSTRQWSEWSAQLQAVVAALHNENETLIRYLHAQAYQSDPDYQQAFLSIKKIGLLYADHAALQDRLVYLTETWVAAVPRTYTGSILPLTHEVMGWTATGRELVRAVLAGNEIKVRELARKLNAMVTQAQGRRTQLLTQGSDREAARWFDTGIRACNQLSVLAGEYMAAPEDPGLYGEAGKACYFYHDRLLPAFNGPDQGLISVFAAIREMDPAPCLPALMEPDRFCPVLRGPRSPQVASPAVVLPDLVFVADISGSMAREDKLPLFKQSFAYWLESMGKGSVGLVTFSGAAKVVAELTDVSASKELIGALQQIEIGGGSLPEEGIRLAYDLAAAPDRPCDLVLITDGGFEITPSLVTLIEARQYQGTALHIFYFGKQVESARPRLAKLAAVGGGKFVHAQPSNADDLINQLRAAYMPGGR